MMIYGVALLAACYLVGQTIGELLGQWLNINSNVGGVGFAMLLLILVNQWMHKRQWLTVEMEKGILFWSNLYIPVIVAMSAIQDVKAAISGGAVALLAGIIPVALSVMMLPLIMRFGNHSQEKKHHESNPTLPD
jgi:malonate transporter MadL subunit